MNRKVIIWDNQNWCYVYHKNDMNGGFDDIYIQIYHMTNDMTRLYHITYNQYETNMTLLTKKDICVSYWKLPGQEELETDQVFFWTPFNLLEHFVSPG
jgi:hypothetical protein